MQETLIIHVAMVTYLDWYTMLWECPAFKEMIDAMDWKESTDGSIEPWCDSNSDSMGSYDLTREENVRDMREQSYKRLDGAVE